MENEAMLVNLFAGLPGTPHTSPLMPCKKWDGWNGWIRKETRLAIYIRDRFSCLYCGKDLRSGDFQDVTLDHLVPRSFGGHNRPSNLVTSCKRCNCSRKDKPWREYAPGYSVIRIQRAKRRKLNRKLAHAIIEGKVSKWEIGG